MINTCESLFEKLMKEEGYDFEYFSHNPLDTYTAENLNYIEASKKNYRPPYGSNDPFVESNEFEDALTYLILKGLITIKSGKESGFSAAYLKGLLKKYSKMLNRKGELKKQHVSEETHSPDLSAEQRKKAKKIYHTFRV